MWITCYEGKSFCLEFSLQWSQQMLHSNLKCTPGFIVLLISKVVVATTVSANMKLSTADQDQTSTNETLKPMSICNVLPCELRLSWHLTGVLNQHLANKLPTCCQQSDDKRATVGRLSPNSWPTVGPLWANCWPTDGRLLTNSRPTVFWGSCSSLFPNEIQVFAGPKLFNLVM